MKHAMRHGGAMLVAAGLTGCMIGGTSLNEGESRAAIAMTCNADSAQSHIGKTADQSVGTAILVDSGARSLRWGPPRSAWTMDYCPDRVNVRYDDTKMIMEITCG